MLVWPNNSPNSLRLRSLSMARRGRTTGMGRSSGGHMSEEWGTITESGFVSAFIYPFSMKKPTMSGMSEMCHD